MKQKVLSSLVLSGAVLVMAPQAWSQAGGAGGAGTPGAGRSGSETQMQKPTDPPMGGQQRPGSSTELQSERGTPRGSAQGQMQSQRTAGQRLSTEKVKEIQEALKDKGQYQGEVDGIIGPKTQQALREFQKAQNLQVTGRVDEKTADALGVELAGAGMGTSGAGSSGVGASGGSKSGAGSPSGKGSEGTGSGVGSGSRSDGKLKSKEGSPK